jgi:hypothetical protein
MAKGGREWRIDKLREVREMRNAETVLAIIRDRGKRGLPLEDVYRMLYNPYLRAYARLYSNPTVVDDWRECFDACNGKAVRELDVCVAKMTRPDGR